MRRVLLLVCLLFTLLKAQSLVKVHRVSEPSSSTTCVEKAHLTEKHLVKEDVEDERNYGPLTKTIKYLSRNSFGSPLFIHLNHLCGSTAEGYGPGSYSPDIYIVQRVLRI